MTQFSRTPLITGARAGLNARNLSGTELAGALRSDPLQVFNPPASTAINEGADLAELRRAFGLVGNVVQAVGGIAQEERERDARLDEGLAAAEAKPQAYQWQEDIANGTIQPPAKSLGAFAKSFIDEHIRTVYGDRSDAFKKKYAEMLFEPFARSLASKRAEIVQRDRKVAIDGLGDIAYRAGTTEDVGRAVQGARDLGLADQEAYAATVLPAMKTAASIGDDKKFEMLAKSLPEGMFSQTVDLERTKLQGSILRRDAERQQNAMAMFAEIANSQPPEIAADALRQLRDSGTLSASNAAEAQAFLDKRQAQAIAQAGDNAVNALVAGVRTGSLTAPEALDQITSAEQTMGVKWANSARETVRSALADQIEAQQQRAENEARTTMLAGYRSQFLSGAPVATFQDSERQVGKKTVKVSGEDAARTLMAEEFAKIDATARSPEEAAYQKVQSVANRGYAPADWSAPLKVPYVAAGSIEKMETLPPSWESALTTYAIMRRTQPHLTTTVLNDNERAFYDAVLSAMPSTTSGGKPNALQAFKQAYAARTRSPEEVAQLTRNIADNKVQSAAVDVVNNGAWFFGERVATINRNIGNLTELQTAIKSEAVRLIRAGEPSPDAAVEKAKDTVKSSGSVINGFWTLTNVEGLPEPVRKDLPVIGQQIIDDYKATTKGDEKLGFSYNAATGNWQIVDFLGLPVDGPLNKTTFRTADLIRIRDERLRKESEAAEQKVMESNRNRTTWQERQERDPYRQQQIKGLVVSP